VRWSGSNVYKQLILTFVSFILNWLVWGSAAKKCTNHFNVGRGDGTGV